jgi:tetratricopeptide (TPR) repeat protein
VCNEPEEPNRDLSLELADRAVALDPNDAGGRWVRGLVLGYERRWSESDQEFSAALELDPNQADARAIRADLATLKGDPKTAIEHVERALRLNLHPAGWYYWELGLAQYAARQYDAAIKTLRKEATYRTGSRRVLAASLAQLGLTEEARREAELFMASNPFFSIGRWVKTQPFHDEATRVHIVEGYRKAGLPD